VRSPSSIVARVPPVYFLEPLRPDEALAGLKATAEDVEASVRDLSEEDMAMAPSPGQWAVRGSSFTFSPRRAFWPGAWTRSSRKTCLPSRALPPGRWARRKFLPQEKSWRGIGARGTPPSIAWLPSRGRTGGGWRHHSEFGVVSLLQQASYFARHDASHLPQIDAIRAAIGA